MSTPVSFTAPTGLAGQVDPLSLLQGYQLDPTQFLARRLMSEGGQPIQARTPIQAVGQGLNSLGGSLLGAALAQRGQQRLVDLQQQDAQALQQALGAAQAPDPTTGQPRDPMGQQQALIAALQGNPRLSPIASQMALATIQGQAQRQQGMPVPPTEADYAAGVPRIPGILVDPITRQPAWNPQDPRQAAVTDAVHAALNPVRGGGTSGTIFPWLNRDIQQGYTGIPGVSGILGQQGTPQGAAPAPGAPNPTNPGNMRVPGQTSFQSFPSPEEGVAGMVRQLGLYAQRGITTPLQIAQTWAPRGDGNNDPEAYAGAIQRLTGLDPNQPVDLSNPQQTAALVGAMARIEQGRPLDPQVLARGLAIAPPGVGRAPLPPMAGAAGAPGANPAAPSAPAPAAAVPNPNGPVSDAAPLATPGAQLAQAIPRQAPAPMPGPPAPAAGPGAPAPAQPPQPGLAPGYVTGTPQYQVPPRIVNGVVMPSVPPADAPETEADRIMAQRTYGRYGSIQDEANREQDRADAMRMIVNVLQQANAGGGPLSGSLNALDGAVRQLTNGMGPNGGPLGLQDFGIAANEPAASLAQKLGNMMSISTMRGVTPRLTNMELLFGSQTVPSLMQTPAGRSLLLEGQNRVADWQQQRADEAQNYMEQHGGRLDYRFEGHMRQWQNQHQLFSDDFAQRVRDITGQPTAAGASAPAPAPTPGAPPPPQVPGAATPQSAPQAAPQRIINPSTGEVRELQNGQWVTVRQ